VVPGGGLSPDHQRWISTSHPRFLLPIAVLHDVFRDKFLAGVRQLYRKNLLDCRGPATDFHDPAWFEQLIEKLGKKDWYVYAKPPFGGPEHVLSYLARYTHRMAISNHRFFLHVLPRGFVRIRHYGLLSNRFRKQLLPLARNLLAQQAREPLPLPPPSDCDLWHCPRCGAPMRVAARFTAAQLYFAGLDSS
jgi:hypothetical protein